MKFRGVVFLFGLLISILASCEKKEDRITISGQLLESASNRPVEGVLVELFAQKIESGIYSAHYDNYGSELSNSEGNFSIEMPNQTYAKIKLSFRKENYYSWENEIEGDAVKNELSHYEVYQMQAKAWLEIQVKNQNPFDLQDYFEIRILNGYTNCEACCSGEVLKFQGMDIDQTSICQMLGGSDVVIRWNTRKEGEQTGGEKLIFVPSFDTTRLVFAY